MTSLAVLTVAENVTQQLLKALNEFGANDLANAFKGLGIVASDDCRPLIDGLARAVRLMELGSLDSFLGEEEDQHVNPPTDSRMGHIWIKTASGVEASAEWSGPTDDIAELLTAVLGLSNPALTVPE
ncbi:hypothetical protein ATO13_08596 [Stappia sp. 22II-S9-Z10]|nr:hypothetical protein ATO13_08596 [Stappia sp. 22II-S9-Z10]